MADKPNKTELGRLQRAAEAAQRAKETAARQANTAKAQKRTEQRESSNQFGNNSSSAQAEQDRVDERNKRFDDREKANGLTDTMSGRGMIDPTFLERETSAGLSDTTSGYSAGDSFYKFPGSIPKENPILDWGVHDNVPALLDPIDEEREEVEEGGRPRLWAINLSDLNLDPFTVASKVMNSTINDWLGQIPSAGELTSIFTGAFAGLTRESGSPPSIYGAIEALFSGMSGVVSSIQNQIDSLLNDFSGIASSLSGHFNGLGEFPKNGDYVYTNEFGIVYTIFEKASGGPGQASPTGNLIFRVEFDVTVQVDGESVSTSFVAITTIPAPDVSALVDTILQYLLQFLQQTIASLAEGVLQGVFGGIIAGLNALFEEILELLEGLLEEILARIEALEALVQQILADLAALFADVESLQDAIDVINGLIDDIQEDIIEVLAEALALNARVTAIEAQLEAAEDIAVIMADGTYGSISVLSYTAGATARREITWVESQTGAGQRSSFIIAQNEATPTNNIGDIDYRRIDYIHPDGTTYTVHPLVVINGAQAGPVVSTDFPDWPITDIEICQNNSPVSKQALLRDAP
jgi:Tfp pilus assembly protein PilX